MKLAIINYGMGNLGSVRRACIELGATVVLAHSPETLGEADRIILPGVGNFSEGIKRLQAAGWIEAIHQHVLEQGKPMLGICLGMQLLATYGDEGGLTTGLGLIPGHVHRLDQLGCSLRIPHVGWNNIQLNATHPLLAHIPSGTDFYFVHSYAFDPIDAKDIKASVDYGTEVTAVIANKHMFGVQFHPEKSSKAGRRLLQNFLDYQSC